MSGTGRRRWEALALWLWIAAALALYLWQFRDLLTPLAQLLHAG